MNRKSYEDQFLDYLEGNLNSAELEEFEKGLLESTERKAQFEAYRRVYEIERAIAKQDHEVSESFVARVMDRIEADQGYFISLLRRLFMELTVQRRALAGGLASLALMVVVVQLAFDAPTPHELKEEAIRSDMVEQQVAAPVVPEVIHKEDGAREDAGRKVVRRDVAKELAAGGSRPEGSIGSASNQGVASTKGDPSANFEEQRKSASTAGLEAMGKKMPIVPLDEGKKKSEFAAGASRPQPLEADAPMGAERRHPSSDAVISQEYYDYELAGPDSALDSLQVPPNDDLRTREAVDSFYRQKNASGERYGQYVENPRIAAVTEAKSTFSIDVDTGSYTNVRRMLLSGVVPPPEAVRIEEFINYFDYGYPVQSEQPFTLSYEIAPAPLDRGRHLLKLGIKAKSAVEEARPWNLVFLIDVSGSMATPDKLPLVQRALTLLVNNMRRSDRLAIVTYAGSASVALPSSTLENRERILEVVRRLSAGGSTHGSAGIRLAYDIAEQNRITSGVNRVILVTDGDFNVGMTDNAGLIRYVEGQRASGVALTTIGVGTGNFNEALIEQLANKGNGNYFYIDNFSEARRVFENGLAGVMQTVAKDVKLQIEFNPTVVSGYRLIGYENRILQKQDFNNDAIDAGEIGSDHTVTALYEVTLVGSELAGQFNDGYRYQRDRNEERHEPAAGAAHNGELAFLNIRYKEPEGSTSKLMSYPILQKDVLENFGQATDDFRFCTAVSYFGHLLRQSQFLGNYGYDDVLRIATDALGVDPQGQRREFVELVRNAKWVAVRPIDGVRPMGSKSQMSSDQVMGANSSVDSTRK